MRVYAETGNTMTTLRLFAVLMLGVVLAHSGAAHAYDLTLMTTNSFKSTVQEIVPQFEKMTGHAVRQVFANAEGLRTKIQKGEAFDVVILSSVQADRLAQEGYIDPATRINIAHTLTAVAVRRGAPKPDISTSDAFKATMLAAKSITYSETGATGVYLKQLFERMGIADTMRPKTKLLNGEAAADMVARGEAEIGLTQVSEILPWEGTELVGTIPKELELITVYPAAANSRSKYPEAARALITFFRSPLAVKALKAKGLEPNPAL